MNPTSDYSHRDCLCLVTGKGGHVVEKCPAYTRLWECSGLTLPPDVEHTRPSLLFGPLPVIERSTHALCQQCTQLDALSKTASHRPFVLVDFADNHSKRATKKTTQIPSLGPIRSLRLFSTCPVCRLIFGVSHLTDEETEIVRSRGVVTGWTIHRLEEDLDWSGYERGKGPPYAECVYTTVTTVSFADGIHEPNRLLEAAVEAIGLVDSDIGEWRPCLGS